MGFGHADLVLAVPVTWVDVTTLDDLDAVAAAFAERDRIEQELGRVFHDMGEASGNAAATERLLREQARLEAELEAAGGHAVDHRVDEALHGLGFVDREFEIPAERLSGGQQQRVAIACALANRPKILLGDEPTGEVDWPTAQRILKLLRDLRERYDLTIVMVTHDPRVAEQADRVIAIRDGRTSTERVNVSEEEAENEGIPTEEQKAAEPQPRTFEELVVLDRAGRLQIPGEQRALAGIGRRARVELVEGGILIRAGDEDGLQASKNGEEAGSLLDGSASSEYDQISNANRL